MKLQQEELLGSCWRKAKGTDLVVAWGRKLLKCWCNSTIAEKWKKEKKKEEDECIFEKEWKLRLSSLGEIFLLMQMEKWDYKRFKFSAPTSDGGGGGPGDKKEI